MKAVLSNIPQRTLNYSVDAILKVFGKYFKTEEEAEPFARNPKALADKVYGHRGGNDGQGYAWRGRGFPSIDAQR